MFMNYYKSLLHTMQPVHIIKVLVDVFVFTCTIGIWILVDLYMPRSKIGFECNDNSIGLPYKESTVKINVQVLFSVFMPLIAITGTEIIRRFYASYKAKKRYVYKLSLCGRVVNVPDTLGSLYINLGAYFYGLMVTSIMVNVLKYTYGRLRPHYIDVCQPMLLNHDSNVFLMHPDCSFKRFFEYGVDYICRGKNGTKLDEAGQSFPSQITAFTFYTAIYLTAYLRFTWNYRKFGLLPAFLQFGLITISSYIGLTRVADYKHFISDVIAGALLGSLTGISVFYTLTDFFKPLAVTNSTNDKDSPIRITVDKSNDSNEN